MNLIDGMVVEFEGRKYRVQVDASSCGGSRHYHPEAHADGSVLTSGEHPEPGQRRWIPHHHHDSRCGNIPRQITLIPEWEITERHIHSYTEAGYGGVCECGAWREVVPMVRPKKIATHRLLRYHMPADGLHPEGWTYERVEELP